MIKSILKGIAGGSGIPALIAEIKKLTPKGAKEFLDINKDGKVDMKDFEALKWETLAKMVTLGAIIWAANHFGILSL